MYEGHHVRRSRIGSCALALHPRLYIHQTHTTAGDALHVVRGNLNGSLLEKSTIVGMEKEANQVSHLEMSVIAIRSVGDSICSHPANTNSRKRCAARQIEAKSW